MFYEYTPMLLLADRTGRRSRRLAGAPAFVVSELESRLADLSPDGLAAGALSLTYGHGWPVWESERPGQAVLTVMFDGLAVPSRLFEPDAFRRMGLDGRIRRA